VAVLLTVVSCIGDDVFDRDTGGKFVYDGLEVYAVASGAACGMDGKDYMYGDVGEYSYLRPPREVCPFEVFCVFGTHFVEVWTDVS